MGVRELYEQTLAERGYRPDPAQLRAIDSLERCETEWADYKARRCERPHQADRAAADPAQRVPVGRRRPRQELPDGLLLQRAAAAAEDPPALPRVHARGPPRAGRDDREPSTRCTHLGKSIARRFRLICLDEFHVADITDAMILHRLLEALFENRVSIVTTSNFTPDDLYPNGLHRDRILPAIELLKEKLEVVNVDNGIDYRQSTLLDVELYHTPLGPAADAAMNEAFERLAEARDESPVLQDRAPRDPRPAARRRRRLVRLQASSAAGRARRTTTSSWRRSSTPCCCPACRRCRRGWPRRRAASPGSSTCSTTAASS